MHKPRCAARARWLALLLLASPAHAAPLTLDEALETFRTRGFDLLLADATLEGARADLESASALPNPLLALTRGRSHGYDPSLCAGCSSTAISVSLTDPGAISDLASRKRALRVRVAEAALAVARSSRADVLRTLQTTLAQQLLSAELAKQAVAYAGEAQSLAGETQRLVEVRYRAGAISEADVARARTLALEADQAADVAREAERTAAALLAYMLGYRDEPAGFEVGDDLLQTPAPPGLEGATPESLIAAARGHRPDLVVAANQMARAQAALALSRRLLVPDVGLSAQYSAEGHGQNAIQPPTVTFGVSAALPLLSRYRGEIAKAEADLRAQEITRHKVEAQVSADVRGAWAAFLGARSRATRLRESLLVSAARARDLVRLQYEKGAGSLFELLDAQRTLLSTQNEALAASNDYWTAVFRLEEATATELRK